MTKRMGFVLLCLIGFLPTMYGQNFAVKTNLLYGLGTLTPNLGVEIGLGEKTTLDLSGGYNPWNHKGVNNNNKKIAHWLGEAEFRYWLCERFNGHFFGAHALASEYNVGGYDIPLLFKKEYRYQGNAFGGGLSYGYHWMLSKNWGLEFNLGLGVAFLDYGKYDCIKCGEKIGDEKKTYFGPTRAGVSLVYIIK